MQRKAWRRLRDTSDVAIVTLLTGLIEWQNYIVFVRQRWWKEKEI